MNTKEAIKNILEQHKIWLESGGKEGTRADFEGANLECANLEGANLKNANLKNANLQGATFEGAELENADFFAANLEGADLRQASLAGTILEKKKVSEQTVSSASNLREELASVAKRHGMKIDDLKLSIL